MKNTDIIKRLYNDYTTKHLNKIILAIVFSILVAGATSATAWLLDPAIEKIFLNKDQSLIFIIPLLMIRRPPRSTPKPSSAASDVYKRQDVLLTI